MASTFVFALLSMLLASCQSRFGGNRRHTEGLVHYLKVAEVSEECTFKSYSPAGKEVTLEKIEAPVATLESKGLYAVFEKDKDQVGKLVSGALKAAGIASSVLSNIPSKVAALAGPHAASALSVFTFLMNTAFPSNTADSVLLETNKALKTLTNQVNIQFENMKAYVDLRIVEAEFRTVMAYLESVDIMINHCARKPDEVDICLDNDFSKIRQYRPSFLKLKNDLESFDKGSEMEWHNIYLLEATLIPVREYGTRLMLVYKTIIDGLKSSEDGDKDKRSSDDAVERAWYLTSMKTDALMFKRFFERALKAIKIAKEKNHCSESSILCDDVKDKKKSCTCNFEKGGQHHCKITIEEKSKSDEGVYRIAVNDNFVDYFSEETREKIIEKEEQYRKEERKVVQKYWNKHIGNFIQNYEKIIHFADEEMQQ